MVYILYGLWSIWRPRFDLRETMRWVATWLAIWNATFLAFGLLVVPFMLEPNDIWVHWALSGEGAGEGRVAIEGLVFPMAGIPILIFVEVVRRLRKKE